MKRLLILIWAILLTVPLSAQKALENDEIFAVTMGSRLNENTFDI